MAAASTSAPSFCRACICWGLKPFTPLTPGLLVVVAEVVATGVVVVVAFAVAGICVLAEVEAATRVIAAVAEWLG